MTISISFLGGAGTVTGSKHLLSFNGKKILVDCGLFQGLKEHRVLNWQPFPIDPKSIDAVALTHAHLDHCGYLPLLVKQGFRGAIYCSAPTAELAAIVLNDAAVLEEEDADHANQYGYTRHHPALPLFTRADAESVFPLFETLECGHWTKIAGGEAQLRLTNSGHILGSTFMEFKIGGRRVVFSGDLGRENPITVLPPKALKDADVLVMESTYGDHCHPNGNPLESLYSVLNKTLLRSGHVVIPAFAIGRTQDILHLISLLKADKRIPSVPVYLDSPMAERSNLVFDRYPQWHKLTSPDLKWLSVTCHRVSSINQSRFLCKSREPSIVIAGSGMLTGGRVLQHLMARLPDKRNTVVLAGYQAAGTLGRFLREGATEAKLFGTYVPARAEIAEISSLSAHADQKEILNWISNFEKPPQRTFLVHGEPNASEGLRVRLRDRFGIIAHIAKMGETFTIP